MMSIDDDLLSSLFSVPCVGVICSLSIHARRPHRETEIEMIVMSHLAETRFGDIDRHRDRY